MDVTEAPLGRRAKRKQEIRGRIEDAAYRLFQRYGIEDTSIEQICVEADVARRTFYGHFTNKHALLGALGISRLYSRAEPMLSELMAAQPTTRGRLEAMIDYIESAFAGMNDIDRQLVLLGPTAFAEDQETQREIGSSAMASFTRLIEVGRELGRRQHSIFRGDARRHRGRHPQYVDHQLVPGRGLPGVRKAGRGPRVVRAADL